LAPRGLWLLALLPRHASRRHTPVEETLLFPSRKASRPKTSKLLVATPSS
ncbi:hypothetical protein COCVIDRAFT_97100, partial [Bipolaris victoriae FI3]